MHVVKFIKLMFNSRKRGSFNEASDDEFYKQLFIKNKSWNTATPNKDELNRWMRIEAFLNGIKQQQQELRILDLGCGRGWLTNLLSGHGEVLGIEPVAPVVAYAKKLFPELKLMMGSTQELLDHNYEQFFDVVVSSEVIEHVSDPNKNHFVSSISRLLKPEGYCILTTPRKEIQEEWNVHKPPNQPVEDWISEDELKHLFNANGFERLGIERIALKAKTHNQLVDVYQVCLFKKQM
ncbi:methyltransferase family protein [Flavobacteriaceae bacterium MAR_2010_105]|nr:methyltransferase family protein [Flavobacteriaceae bacterium MAR_2010_105]